MEYYPAIKKEHNSAICNNMDGPRGYTLSENSQRKKNTVLHLYMESKNTKQMNIMKKELFVQRTNRCLPERRKEISEGD